MLFALIATLHLYQAEIWNLLNFFLTGNGKKKPTQ